MVVRTIRSQSTGIWSAAFYRGSGADAKTRFEIVLQCATHLHHHIGQMTYLGFELKRGLNWPEVEESPSVFPSSELSWN